MANSGVLNIKSLYASVSFNNKNKKNDILRFWKNSPIFYGLKKYNFILKANFAYKIVNDHSVCKI